jgi:hypothetical protein
MAKLGKHVYEWDKVVIGGDLRSLLFAANYNYPVIFVEPSPPFRFNILDPELDLSEFGLTEQREIYELELWEKMFFILGLSGLSPLSSKAQGIRVKQDTLIITTESLRVVKAKFSKLVVFEDKNLKTLPELVKKQDRGNKVIDWFNIRSGCRHKLNILHGNDNFISRIHFYPTDRSDNKTFKDAVSISYLKKSQLQNTNFSEYMARFKVEHMMKEAGIKGMNNGYVGRPIYSSVRAEHAERQVIPQIKRLYKPDDRYEFRYDTVEDILNNVKLSGYTRKMARML